LKANNVDIWVLSAAGAGNARFTFDPSEEVAPVWSRDGSLISFRSVAEFGAGIMMKKSNGLEKEKRIMAADAVNDFIPNSWSLDGTQLFYTAQSPGQEYLALLSVADGKSVRFLTSKANQTNGQISPDGKWLAYASDESGTWEIYVTSFPNAAGKWQVSRGGGTEPRWRGDGKEIYYLAPSGMLMAVPVNAQGIFCHRRTRTVVSNSWPGPDFFDRRIYL
jgi:eukaryotic-like serine/threonine-protein kinase